MSSPWLPREPAYQAGPGSASAFEPVGPDVRGWLVSRLVAGGAAEDRREAEVRRLPTALAPPLGHYRVTVGGRVLFIKVLAEDQDPTQVLAESLALAAARRGGPALAASCAIPAADGAAIRVYPYIDARFADATPQDADALGATLARLHDALPRGDDLAEIVSRRTRERTDLLERRRRAVLTGEGPCGPAPDRLAALAGRFEPGRFVAVGRVIHGDANPGNILVDRKTGRPTFIDFETATVSALDPVVDVATVLQRTILIRPLSREERGRLSARLTASYLDASRRPGASPSDGQADAFAGRVAEALSWLCARNLCLLAEAESRGRVSAAAEWQKFLDLAAAAPVQGAILAEAMPGRRGRTP